MLNKMKPTEFLKILFMQWSGSEARTIVPLPLSGSARSYYRLSNEKSSAIGVYHTDKSENNAFVIFARHFEKLGIPVPEIYLTDLSNNVYLQRDLGDSTLFDMIQEDAENGTALSEQYLRQTIDLLPEIQTKGHKGMDYSVAYPRESFDIQSMRWDLNYFKYHFLKFTGLNFNEQKLENDFDEIIRVLDSASRDYFLYRDFQTRNIMVADGQVWFIDFQGGRQGYPAYDLASLLFDAKADLSPSLRQSLLDQYLPGLQSLSNIKPADFLRMYPGFVLIRMLQAMGAFGFRGIFEQKTHFIQSIPYALDNGKWIIENFDFPFAFPELCRILNELPGSAFRNRIEKQILSLSL